LHRQGVDEQQPAAQYFACNSKQLERFCRLYGPDDSSNRRKNAHYSARRLFIFPSFRKKARVAGRIIAAHVEHGHLPIEANRSAGDKRFPMQEARTIYRVARREVIAAVENHIGLGGKLRNSVFTEALSECDHPDLRIDRSECCASR
jgi:hypothetical protein